MLPPVAYAVSMNKPALLKQLLDSGENIEGLDPMGLTPLGLAITEKKPKMVTLLLNAELIFLRMCLPTDRL